MAKKKPSKSKGGSRSAKGKVVDDVLAQIEKTLAALQSGASNPLNNGSQFLSKLSKYLKEFGDAGAEGSTRSVASLVDTNEIDRLLAEARSIRPDDGGSETEQSMSPTPTHPVRHIGPGDRSARDRSTQPKAAGGKWGAFILQIIIAVLGELRKE